MITKIELESAVKEAQLALNAANDALRDFTLSAENNVYATLDEAESAAEDILRDMAFADCEGAGNCGLDTYTMHVMVDGKKYLATLTVEYNRHDKTYYYIDESEITLTEVAD